MERKPHDVGGMLTGEILLEETAETLFEKRVDAMVMLLTNPKLGVFKVDALRRAVESNTAEDYTNLMYYQKWMRAIRLLLVEQSVLTDAEIEERIAEVSQR